MTSRDVVNRVQQLVRPAKVGHAGTLDPLATGVLVVCIGAATRLVEFVQRMPKVYRAAFRLGQRSDTDDREGHVEELPDPPRPTRAQVEQALPNFVGRILQRPPAYSAVKVGGKRAYALARQGQAIELQARPVDIYAIRLESYDYPELRLEIECGSGTYVRSLGRDLAEVLGTSAILVELARTRIGCFSLEHAVSLDELTLETLERHLLPPLLAMEGLPRIVLPDDELRRMENGQMLRRPNHGFQDPVAAVDARGELRGVLCSSGEHQLRPDIVLVRPV